MSFTVADLYDNYGWANPDRALSALGNPTIPVSVPSAPAGLITPVPVTCMFVCIEGVTQGDLLDIDMQIVLTADPRLAPVVAGLMPYVEPTESLTDADGNPIAWQPTPQAPQLRGMWIAGEDINYIPAAGSGKYLVLQQRILTRWPWPCTRDVLAVAAVYANSDDPSNIKPVSFFASQSYVRALRTGPGWRGGVWRGITDKTMTLGDIEPPGTLEKPQE